MVDLRVRTATTVSRILCAASLLFVFFLPLHFHFSLTPQLSSQCSCLQGARPQLIMRTAAPAILAATQYTLLFQAQSDEWTSTTPQRPSVRGPPLSLPV